MHALLIWFDYLPYALPGCCGNTEARTPGFDRFAAGSVTFDNCFIDDRCSDTGASLVEILQQMHELGAAVHVLAVHPTRLVELLRRYGDGRAGAAIDIAMLDDDEQLTQRLVVAVESPRRDPSSDGELPCVVTVVAMPGVVTREGKEIDELLEAADRLLDRLAVVPTSERTLLLVTAGGGQIAAEDADELNERSTHVPLLGRVGPPLEFGLHTPSLVAQSDVVAALLAWTRAAMGEKSSKPAAHAAALLRELSGERSDSRPSLFLRGHDGRVGMRTPQWYLATRLSAGGGSDAMSRAVESAALYQKPDDLWESLDMASQCPAVVEELVSMLLTVGGKSGEVRQKHR
jgi:hypothetical protein